MPNRKSKFCLAFDEVGKGALAGPVVVAGVLVPYTKNIPKRLRGLIIKDSKKMSRLQRNKTASIVRAVTNYGVGLVSAMEIEKIGIAAAVKCAARDAKGNIEKKSKLDYLDLRILVDGKDSWFPGDKPIIDGDNLMWQISLASIIAKVYRDKLMASLALIYPFWQFEKHVGYGTLWHRKMIQKFGLITGLHRFSWCRKIAIKPMQINQNAYHRIKKS